MKSVFIAGSRKFYNEINQLAAILQDHNIKVLKAGKSLDDKFEKKATKRALERIAKSDILYVFANEGYSGTTVRGEIAFAHAASKEIISSCALNDYIAKSWVHKTMPVSDLIKYCSK